MPNARRSLLPGGSQRPKCAVLRNVGCPASSLLEGRGRMMLQQVGALHSVLKSLLVGIQHVGLSISFCTCSND